MVERTRTEVNTILDAEEGASRHRLAEFVADHFPLLQPRLPPPRKPWQPQDLRMSAFYAVALGLTANRKRSAPDLNQAAERRE